MTKKSYQYISLDRIPYNGIVNVYGIVLSVEKKQGLEKIVIKDEFGHVIIVPDLSLLDHVEVGYILRLHRSMVATPSKLLYKPHVKGNSAVVWDLSSSFIPKYHNSPNYTIEELDRKRITELRQLSAAASSECQNVVHADLTSSYKKKIVSHILNLPYESIENYSLSQRSALENVSVSCAKTISSFSELNTSFLTGKVFFNFVAFVAEVYKQGQVVYVRVFDGTQTPIASSLYKVNSNEVVVVKTMPEKDIIEKAENFLFDVACFGEHATEALELQVGNVAVFANARVYTRKMGDKVICLHEGEMHRRVAASVGNVECEIITAMKQRCEDALSDLYSCSQSQSVFKYTQTQNSFHNDSLLNFSSAQPEEDNSTNEGRKRKTDKESSLAEPPNKRIASPSNELTCTVLNVPASPVLNATQNNEHELIVVPERVETNDIAPSTTATDGVVVSVAESPQLSHEPNQSDHPNDELVQDEQQIVIGDISEAEVVDENSRDAAVISVLTEIVESLSQQDVSIVENTAGSTEDDVVEEVVEACPQAREEDEEEEEPDSFSPELLVACKMLAQYKTLSNQIKKLFVFDDDKIATIDEEIDIIRTLEPDSPCVMENFVCVDSYHFMNQSFYAHCVIFTGNCDTCLNEFRVDRKASIGCPFCLDKRQKSKRFKVGIRILLPIRKDFLIGLSREQIMHVFPSQSLDSERVTEAFHASEEDFLRWCSDVQVIATSVVGTYKIRPNYCRTITKSPTILFIEDCDLEKKF